MSTLAVFGVFGGVDDLRCPSRAWLGWFCPGCGLSRAWNALLDGDGLGSLAWHPGLLWLLAVGAFFGACLVDELVRGVPKAPRSVTRSRAGRSLFWATVVVFGATAIGRATDLLPLRPLGEAGHMGHAEPSASR